MSHRATNWLASLGADRIGASEFRVLFHLCDCHNPSQGCFPTQAYLIAMTGASNGTVNNALNSLETKGLIRRHRTRDGKSKRQNPTRYILGFELGETQEPTPETGDGMEGKSGGKTGPHRLQSAGDGAVSKKRGEPSPISGATRLQPTGEVTCKEPVINQRAGAKPVFFTSDEKQAAKELARFIEAGGKVVLDWPGAPLKTSEVAAMIRGGKVAIEAIPYRVRDCLVAGGLLSRDLLISSGFADGDDGIG